MLQAKGALRHMLVSEEWTSSSYAKTNARFDVANWIFDEQGFWVPIVEIAEVNIIIHYVCIHNFTVFACFRSHLLMLIFNNNCHSKSL